LPKKTKKGKTRQILQSYNTAQFVQYGKIRVKYHTAYFTNTPYDPSLFFTEDVESIKPWGFGGEKHTKRRPECCTVAVTPSHAANRRHTNVKLPSQCNFTKTVKRWEKYGIWQPLTESPPPVSFLFPQATANFADRLQVSLCGAALCISYLNLVQICDPVLIAQRLADELTERRVAKSQPTSLSHAICLVLELVRPQLHVHRQEQQQG
jgi:hypothetical protein